MPAFETIFAKTDKRLHAGLGFFKNILDPEKYIKVCLNDTGPFKHEQQLHTVSYDSEVVVAY